MTSKFNIKKSLMSDLSRTISFDSDSDFANSMKIFISQKIDEGYLEDEIYSLLIKKYGQWIVYDPGLSKNTFLLWLIPLLLFI